MDNSHQTIKVIGALAIGTLTGVLFGVLFAPDKGSKTRDKLLGKAKCVEEDATTRMKEDIIAFRSRADQLERLLAGNFKATERIIKSE